MPRVVAPAEMPGVDSDEEHEDLLGQESDEDIRADNEEDEEEEGTGEREEGAEEEGEEGAEEEGEEELKGATSAEDIAPHDPTLSATAADTLDASAAPAQATPTAAKKSTKGVVFFASFVAARADAPCACVCV